MNTAPTSATSSPPRGTTIAFALLIFLAALLPRTLMVGRFLTIDEAYHWFDRAQLFLVAIRSGDWAGTNLIGHPGVTTMWLGAVGVWLYERLVPLGLWHGSELDFQRMLLRLPIATANAVGIALAFPLLQRLFDRRIALLAGLLWATEPFLVAHGQILHLDATLTVLVMLAMLTALLAFGFDRVADPPEKPQRRWLILSGVCAGLALLTKSPGLIVIPMIGLIALAGSWRAPHWLDKLAIKPLLLWGAVAVATWVICWPAAWVGLLHVVHDIFIQARYDGGEPHGWGNFFMGRELDDPGPLFYPVVLALRVTPWTLLGTVLCGSLLSFGLPRLRSHRALTMLAVFGLLFLLMMSIPPKKFDRYILPLFPILCTFAACGWIWLVERLALLRPSLAPERVRQTMSAVTVLLLALAGWTLLDYHPYEMAYYNPLLGGGAKAVQVIPVGWGEGLEQAAAFIRAQPNGCDRPVAVWFGPAIRPFLCNGTLPMRWGTHPGSVDYAVLYRDQIQRNDSPDTIRALQRTTPLHTVTIHGIEYAYVYEVVPPLKHSVDASFGDAIHLTGYQIYTDTLQHTGVFTLDLQWEASAIPPVDYMLFVHVLNEKGERVAQIDVPPAGPRAPSTRWLPGQHVFWAHPVPLLPGLDTGTYRIMLGLYDPTSFARLPVFGPQVPAGDSFVLDQTIVIPRR